MTQRKPAANHPWRQGYGKMGNQRLSDRAKAGRALDQTRLTSQRESATLNPEE